MRALFGIRSAARSITRGKTLARRLMFYMLGLPADENLLLKDYRKFLAAEGMNSKVSLPKQVA